MAYRYRLEKLLKLRRIEESEAVEQLQQQQRQREECQRQLTMLEQAWQSCRERLYESKRGLDGREFALLCRRAQVLEQRLELLRQGQRDTEQKLQECQQQLEQRVAARRSQQQHRERQQQKWAREQKRRRQRREDELGRLHAAGSPDEALEVDHE